MKNGATKNPAARPTRIRGIEMDRYEALLACYLSEQMSARQWQEHLREDPSFRRWVQDRGYPTFYGKGLKQLVDDLRGQS